jgi:hypothetical protein
MRQVRPVSKEQVPYILFTSVAIGTAAADTKYISADETSASCSLCGFYLMSDSFTLGLLGFDEIGRRRSLK